MGQPGVLTRTVAALSATTFGGDGAAGGGVDEGLDGGGGDGGVGGGHLKLNERNSGIRYTIYKYKIITLNK
jgi:hypothetical protein